jgi:glycosyltransferase involved in cell wall biosynthesis
MTANSSGARELRRRDDRRSPFQRQPSHRQLIEDSQVGNPKLTYAATTYPSGFLLSVIIPVFNEETTIERVIQRVRQSRVPTEIIVVDDGSTDGTSDVLTNMAHARDIRLVTHTRNQGKGAAVRCGCSIAEGTLVMVQDADLEYDPGDFERLIQPILRDEADVVYGSRFVEPNGDGALHRWGNRLITFLSNRVTRLNLTDVETCYKVLRRGLADEIIPQLQENGFGIEIELTSRLARKGARIVEVPIRYRRRTYAEGKKIGIVDAIRAMWCIFRY